MSESKDVEVVPVDARPKAIVPAGGLSEIAYLMDKVIDQSGDVSILERLVALKERMDERDARTQFNAALAAFQAECAPIYRRRGVDYVSKKSGSRVNYSFASLDDIVEVIRPILTKLGLSYSWDSGVAEGGLLSCVCKLRHVAGHFETASFACPTDSASGMSRQQECAAALTFARRQSLVQVLGLTMTDQDNDGATIEKISAEQEMQLEEWLNSSGANREKFLKDYMHVEKIGDILARDFDMAVQALKDKQAGKAVKKP